jgi:hypothetical protein
MMATVRNISNESRRDWSRWSAFYPAARRARVETDRGNFFDVDASDERIKDGSRVSIVYMGCGYFINEVLPF